MVKAAPDQQPPFTADGLQLREERRWQRGFWRAERIGWLGFALLLALAVVGLTGGGGPLSVREVQAGGATVDAPRVVRLQAAQSLGIRFADGAAPRITLGPGFTDAFSVEKITPTPEAERLDAAGLRLEFGAGTTAAAIDVRARAPGLFRYRLAAGGAARATWTAVMP